MHRFIKGTKQTDGGHEWLVVINNPLSPPVFDSVFEVRTKAGRRQYVRIRRILRVIGSRYVCTFESFAEARQRLGRLQASA